MNVAFCINKLGMLGLGSTVSSLIRNCSNTSKLGLYFLCNGLHQKDKDHLIKLLKSEQFQGNFHLIDFDPIEIFGDFRSLQGDWTTYGRLLLSTLIHDDQVLYLDADLIVEMDVLEFESFNFNGHALAAVISKPLSKTLEHDFFITQLGLAPHLNSFNAGVLLMDLKEWREKNIQESCLNIGRKYPTQLLACDQTILNAYFGGNFVPLPHPLNFAWYFQHPKPNLPDERIFHFVGSPKPWDPIGSFMHNGYSTWKKYSNEEWISAFGSYSFIRFRRMWKIRNSYAKVLLKKIKSAKYNLA